MAIVLAKHAESNDRECFEKIGKNQRRAAELSGFDLFSRLAGRYLYETSQTDQAIAYLTVMQKNARKDSIRQSFQLRLQALKEVQRVEIALKRYLESHDQPPDTLQTLLDSGFLVSAPVDPYGGTFYIDEAGRVRTTSKFAFSTQK